MALRLQAGGYSAFEQIENINWTAYLYGPAGASITVPTDDSIFSLRYDAGQSDIHTKILPSSATVNVLGFSIDQAEDLEALFTEISQADEGDFILKIYKNTVLEWVGIVLSDQIIFSDDKLPKVFSIRAVCGLAKLKEVEFNKNATEFQSGTWDSISKMITIALKKTGLFDELPIGLKASTGWTCAQVSGYSSFLEGIRLNHVVWLYIDGKGDSKTTTNKKSKSAWQVLEEICTLFHARILLSKGSYWFIQISQYLQPALAGIWNFDGNGNSIGTSSGLPIMYQSDRVQRIGASWEFQPAVKKVVAIYRHSSADNVQVSLNFISGPVTVEDIESFDGTAKVLISFILTYPTNLNTGQFPTYQSHIHKFSITIKIGDKWLKREAKIILGQIVYTDPVWVSVGAEYEFFVYPTFGPNGNNRYNFSVVTPPLPADGTATISLRYVFTHIISANTISIISGFEWSVTNGNFQVLPEGLLEEAFNVTEFYRETNATKSTKTIELTTQIGDGPYSHTLTTMKARTGEGNVQPITQSWTGVGVTGSVHDVLVSSVVKFSGKAAKKITLPFIGGQFSPHAIIQSDGLFFIMLSVDYNAKENSWNGVFVQVADNPTGLGFPPKKFLTQLPSVGKNAPVPIPYFPTVPDDGKLDLPEVKKSDITTLRTGIIPIIVTEPIEVGQVQQIKVSPLELDKVLLVGDKLIVTDVKTGVPTVFTVTQNTAPGSDTVYVQTQTITDRIVDGSYGYLDPEFLYTRGVLGLSNVGLGLVLYKGMNGKTAEIKTLIAGSNISLSDNGSEITISFGGTVFTSFTISADGGTANPITNGETLTIFGGTAISTQVATNQITVNLNIPELLTASPASGDYLSIYDISSGNHSRITIQDILNLVPGGFTSFLIGADTGSQNTITNGETFFVSGGGGLRTVVTTNQVTVFLDFFDDLLSAFPASGDVLAIYDISSGTHSKITIQDILNLVPSGFTSFTISADGGTPNSITNGETLTIFGGAAITTQVGTNQVTVNININELATISPATNDLLLIYDSSLGQHGKITIQDVLNLVSSGFSSFNIGGDSGTINAITNGETLTVSGGIGLSSQAITNGVVVNLDINSLGSISLATNDRLAVYDSSTGGHGSTSIQDILNLASSGFAGFNIGGDSGTINAITDGETLTVSGGIGLSSQAITNGVVVNLDINSLSFVSPAFNDKIPIYDVSTGSHGHVAVQDIVNLSGGTQLSNFVQVTNSSGEYTLSVTGVNLGVVATYWETQGVQPGIVSVKSWNSTSVTFVFRDYSGNLMANTTVGCIWMKS